MIIGPILKNASIISSAAGFYTTAKKVSKCTTPAGVVGTACKGIIIDCTPP